MNEFVGITQFITVVSEDARIGPAHISLYAALLKIWGEQAFQNPIQVKGREVMQLSKIAGVATYHKCIKELHQYGYIQYTPSFYWCSKSLVFLAQLDGGGVEA
jgi:hypothetical protein